MSKPWQIPWLNEGTFTATTTTTSLWCIKNISWGQLAKQQRPYSSALAQDLHRRSNSMLYYIYNTYESIIYSCVFVNFESMYNGEDENTYCNGDVLLDATENPRDFARMSLYHLHLNKKYWMLKLKKAIYLCVSQTLYIEGNIAMIATLKNATFCQTVSMF